MERSRLAPRASRQAKGPERAPLAPRQSFVETAYWNPSVVTGKDGKARVTFSAPTALSQYRFTARGVTGADTLAGETTADLAVRKDVFVDLKTPASLTQGDKPRLTARLHHSGVKGKATITLKGYPGDLADSRTLDVSADGVDEVTFDPFVVPDNDSIQLELTATLGEARDTVKVEVTIRPRGVQAYASASGTASNDATAFVGLPPGRSYLGTEMVVVLSPTVKRLLVELALGQRRCAIEPTWRDLLPVSPTPWPTGLRTCSPARRPWSTSARPAAPRPPRRSVWPTAPAGLWPS